jgi:superfamily II DNA/RNA helicase
MNLDQFSCGQKPLLLATDLAARGIDIPSVQFVIQYDFPGNLQQYVHRCGRAGRSPSISDQNPKPTIYSFFTRNLQAMAPDLVQLLEANHAWVDPNLRALARCDGGDKPSMKKKKVKSKDFKVEPTGKNNLEDVVDDEEDGQLDDFPELAPNRIVLKRASHVSDASSSSDESNSDDGE